MYEPLNTLLEHSSWVLMAVSMTAMNAMACMALEISVFIHSISEYTTEATPRLTQFKALGIQH